MKTLFWNVDTQYDFMRDDKSFKGALPISGARSIEKNLESLTKYARGHGYQIINTADWHTKDSKEFSENPDYKNTFPAHCLQNTKGAEFVPATKPVNPYIVDWNGDSSDIRYSKIYTSKETIIYKDAFDVFEGNKLTKEVVETLEPDRVIVYGVATDVCVNDAIKGLIKKGIRVYVPTDAIKEINSSGLESILKKWEFHRVRLTSTKEVLDNLRWIDE